MFKSKTTYKNINEIQKENVKEAIKEIIKVLNDKNIPQKRGKKIFEEAKKEIEEILKKYKVRGEAVLKKSSFLVNIFISITEIGHIVRRNGEWKLYVFNTKIKN